MGGTTGGTTGGGGSAGAPASKAEAIKAQKKARREASGPQFRGAEAAEEIADLLEEIQSQQAMTNVHLSNIANALSRIANKP